MRNFIIGSDWGEDCDDAVAMRIIARYARDKKINLLGVGLNAHHKYAYASMYAFLENEGIYAPIGLDSTLRYCKVEARYQPRLASYAPKLSNRGAVDAYKLYRKLISECEGKVEIIEIGFPYIIKKLLESEADEYSSLNGVELVKKKVSAFWIMGGKWDEQGGLEYNFSAKRLAGEAASVLCEKSPVPITFLGWEIGSGLITGGKLKEGDLLRDVLVDHCSSSGRESWDPMTVLLAMLGSPEEAGYDYVRGTARVEPKTGKNYFHVCENGMHSYVIKKFDDSYYADAIDEIIK